MKIGELAQRTGIAASAIRYYEEQGLLEPPTRDSNGYRHYSEAAVERLVLVRDAQRLGFTLEIIKSLFPNDGSCSKILTIQQIDIRLEEVRQIEASMALQRQELLGLRNKLEDSLRTGIAPVCKGAQRAPRIRPDRAVTPHRERAAALDSAGNGGYGASSVPAAIGRDIGLAQ